MSEQPDGLPDDARLCPTCGALPCDQAVTISTQQSKEIELREAAQAFVDKIDSIHKDDKYRLVWELNHIRNGPYTGPQYADELLALRTALAQGAGE
jgi:hypothetical protein